MDAPFKIALIAQPAGPASQVLVNSASFGFCHGMGQQMEKCFQVQIGTN